MVGWKDAPAIYVTGNKQSAFSSSEMATGSSRIVKRLIDYMTDALDIIPDD